MFVDILLGLGALVVWYFVGMLAILAVDVNRWIIEWLKEAPTQLAANLAPLIWPLIIWSNFYGGLHNHTKSAVIRTLALKHRLISWLYPVRYIPEPEPNDFYKGVRGADVLMSFTMADRIRLLFSGRLQLEVFVITPEHVERMSTTGGGYVLPPQRKAKPKKLVSSRIRAAIANLPWKR